MFKKIFFLLFIISCSAPYQKEIKTSKEDLKQIEIKIVATKKINKEIKKKAIETNDALLLDISNELDNNLNEINKYQELLGVRLNNIELSCKMEVNKYKQYEYYFYGLIFLIGIYLKQKFFSFSIISKIKNIFIK